MRFLPQLAVFLCLRIGCVFATEQLKNSPLLDADLFEGDIAGVSAKNLHELSHSVSPWENGIVPFRLDSRLDYIRRRAIDKATREIERKSCVRFVNKSSEHTDYVFFTDANGCYSYMGRKGGKQQIGVGEKCGTVGDVLHLLMHSLGFWHEQSRNDRDDYVLVNWDNIPQDKRANFKTYTLPKSNHFGEKFDYKSIMFVSPFAYAIDKKTPTILSKDERYKIGQRYALSQRDINKIVKCYCGRRLAGQSELAPDADEPVPEPELPEAAPALRRSPQSLMGAPQIKPCGDMSEKCPLWATQGHCYKRREFMAEQCQESCSTCQRGSDTQACDDSNSLCGVWTWLGRCEEGSGSTVRQVLQTCPLACGVCLPPHSETPPDTATITDCRNYHDNCGLWANSGKCFYQHILSLCPRACRECSNNRTDDNGGVRPSCQDRNPSRCRVFGERRMCGRAGVRRMCPRSCGQCPGAGVRLADPRSHSHSHTSRRRRRCRDSHALCSIVSRFDHTCANTNRLMRRLCKRSCGLC